MQIFTKLVLKDMERVCQKNKKYMIIRKDMKKGGSWVNPKNAFLWNVNTLCNKLFYNCYI